MATIVTRSGKGSPLTHGEVDANFTNLNTAKAELSGAIFSDSIVFDTSYQFDLSLARTTGTIVIRQSGGTAGNGQYSVGLVLGKINSTRPGAAIASVQTSADVDQFGLSFLTHSSSSTNDVLTEAARYTHDGKLLLGTTTDTGGALLQIDGDRLRIGTAKTPASATATGTAGEICWDASYIYVCTATNTWKRSALSSW